MVGPRPRVLLTPPLHTHTHTHTPTKFLFFSFVGKIGYT
jgi:hypothetical protein